MGRGPTRETLGRWELTQPINWKPLLVVGLVFSEAVCGPAYLLGLMSAESDVIGYVARTGASVWLVRGALAGLSLLSLIILWVVGSEIRTVWTTRFAGCWEPVSPSPPA